jgi:hypothetical protein
MSHKFIHGVLCSKERCMLFTHLSYLLSSYSLLPLSAEEGLAELKKYPEREAHACTHIVFDCISYIPSNAITF